LALAGLWATWTRSQSVTRTAMTGLREGEESSHITPDGTAPVPPPPLLLPPSPEPTAAPSEAAGVRVRPAPRERTVAREPPPGTSRPDSQVVRIGNGVKGPRKLKDVRPVYPDIARQARVQGSVVMECRIDPSGRVTEVRVLRGVPLLDASAMDAVRQWVYEPTVLNGVAVPVLVTVTVNYRLSAE